MSLKNNTSGLKGVAQLAGVSIATVSRVINGDNVVKGETLLKVQAAIKTLGYKPNRVAQRLRSTSRRRKLIGLLIPDIQNPYYIDVIRGIDEYASNHGASIIIGNFSQDVKREKMYIDVLSSESVDGFIIATTYHTEKLVEGLVKGGMPVICIDRAMKNLTTDVVKSDNVAGAFSATEHLIKLGHQRIAMIAGDLQIPTSLERIAGFKQAHERYGLKVDEKLIFSRKSDYTSGIELTVEIIRQKNLPTALFTGNNLLTLGAFETLHKNNIDIPTQMALVGFDDVYWASSLNPALTAVKQFGYEMGQRAMGLLFKRIEYPDSPPANHIINTELMVRRSCGSM